MCKHVGEFESMFLSDLDGGQLSAKVSYDGLEGDLLNFSLRFTLSVVTFNTLKLWPTFCY